MFRIQLKQRQQLASWLENLYIKHVNFKNILFFLLFNLTFTEAILETTVNFLQVSHATGTGGLSSLALFGPVD
jgi:hypothetical protein